MLLNPKTIAAQQKLAKYCRDGEAIELEGADSARLHHYRRLVFNVVYGINEKAFPITKSILSEAEFKELINAYLIHHDAQNPQVWRMPGELLEFFLQMESPLKVKYPFLLDLMRMEWTEILVYNREDRKIPRFNPIYSENEVLILNPDHEIIELNYPVFKSNRDTIEELKSTYHLLLSRNLETKKVHFIEISSLHVHLIHLLSGGDIFRTAAANSLEKFDISNTEAYSKLMAFGKHLFDQNFVLGGKV